MIFTIRKGRHSARPLRPWLWWGRTSFKWEVLFTPSCRYNLNNDDQDDTNKLCGVGYLPNHHRDSARFGWRYRSDQDRIELLAYCYVNGQRVIQSIGLCRISEFYKLQLVVGPNGYNFYLINGTGGVIGIARQLYTHKRKIQYKLGVYFGGNQVAPHNMNIHLKSL